MAQYDFSRYVELKEACNAELERFQQKIREIKVGLPGAIDQLRQVENEFKIYESGLEREYFEAKNDAYAQARATNNFQLGVALQTEARDISQFSTDLSNLISNKQASAEEAARFAARQANNAGNGTPGSAPASQDAGNVQSSGTTVTTEPNANGAAAQASAPNEQKPVTNQEADLQEVQVTSNLREVQVTSRRGITLAQQNNRGNAAQNDADNEKVDADWRVRLALADSANYLYMDAKPGILQPLRETKGVIFPYTPSITVQYTAAYDPQLITHSNYKTVQYQASSVDSVAISCEFTAQDTFEANYLLATIHFFRSLTKMFYGQDQDPRPGNPPPLCFLYGLGAYQFDEHPLVITNFTYALPTNVDYIRATVHVGTPPGTSQPGANPKGSNTVGQKRLEQSSIKIAKGGKLPPPKYTNEGGTVLPTYVPTLITLNITGVPVVSRNAASNKFSLKDYANGRLLRGSTSSSKGFGGFW